MLPHRAHSISWRTGQHTQFTLTSRKTLESSWHSICNIVKTDSLSRTIYQGIAAILWTVFFFKAFWTSIEAQNRYVSHYNTAKFCISMIGCYLVANQLVNEPAIVHGWSRWCWSANASVTSDSRVRAENNNRKSCFSKSGDVVGIQHRLYLN